MEGLHDLLDSYAGRVDRKGWTGLMDARRGAPDDQRVGELARLIRARRAELGLTLREVAQRAGMSTSGIGSLEKVPGQVPRDIPAAVAGLGVALQVPQLRVRQAIAADLGLVELQLDDHDELTMMTEIARETLTADQLARFQRMAMELMAMVRGETSPKG